MKESLSIMNAKGVTIFRIEYNDNALLTKNVRFLSDFEFRKDLPTPEKVEARDFEESKFMFHNRSRQKRDFHVNRYLPKWT